MNRNFISRSFNCLLALIVGGSLSLTAHAQDPNTTTQTPWDKLPLHFGINVTGGRDFDDFQSFSFNLSAEYDFAKRFFLISKYDDTYGLFKDGNNRTWYQNHALGGGLGAHLFSFGSNAQNIKEESLDLCLTAGGVVGKSDWRYVYYDEALRLASLRLHRATISVGYRYYDATGSSLVGNLSHVYVSIGWRF